MALWRRDGLFWLKAAALLGLGFGLLTLISGGAALFTPQGQQAAGNYVPFVLWFNFLAGFAYVIAGLGLWQRQRWAMWVAMVIAGATLLVFIALGWHILNKGSYEMRTIGAMSFRTIVWVIISILAYYKTKDL